MRLLDAVAKKKGSLGAVPQKQKPAAQVCGRVFDEAIDFEQNTMFDRPFKRSLNQLPKVEKTGVSAALRKRIGGMVVGEGRRRNGACKDKGQLCNASVQRLFALLQFSNEFVDPLYGEGVKALNDNSAVTLNSGFELLAFFAHWGPPRWIVAERYHIGPVPDVQN